MVRTEDDREMSLRKMITKRPAVLIFYRGGWCPFCTRHLQALSGIEDELAAVGGRLVAISMDQPAKIKAMPDRDKLRYTLMSDSDAAAAKAFGIAFRVDDATAAGYSDHGIDLKAASGKDHRSLPHPAVFIVDAAGTIRFAHVNPDYRVRLEASKVLDALRASVTSR
jgi:peroxiredoxin